MIDPLSAMVPKRTQAEILASDFDVSKIAAIVPNIKLDRTTQTFGMVILTRRPGNRVFSPHEDTFMGHYYISFPDLDGPGRYIDLPNRRVGEGSTIPTYFSEAGTGGNYTVSQAIDEAILMFKRSLESARMLDLKGEGQ